MLLKLLNLLLKLLIVNRLLFALESSSFVEAVESVVEAVDCCSLYYVLERALILLKLLNPLLKMLIVVGIMCPKELYFGLSC